MEFLRDLFVSIEKLDYTDFEIVVSDDSNMLDDKIGLSAFVFKELHPNIPVSYYHNPNPGKSSINMNHAISKAAGEIIKPMFCDDYFIYPDTLTKIEAALQADDWCFVRSEHKESGRATHTPYVNNDLFSHDKGLAEGCNTYGCPSAMAFRRTDLKFDENLIWLMDCEFYVRMQQRYGMPAIVDSAVNIREWEGQQSKTACNGNVVLWEREYVSKKYRV